MSSIDTTMERVLAAEVLCIESFLMGLQRLRFVVVLIFKIIGWWSCFCFHWISLEKKQITKKTENLAHLSILKYL